MSHGAEAAAPLRPGDIVDRYVVEEFLGEGGMAWVWRVRHSQLDSLHALKVLSVPTRSVVSRLLLEGRIQGQLRHPNVVAVTDVVDVRGSPGLVAEYVDGPTLRQLLNQGPLSLPAAVRLGADVIRGVQAAHRLGLVHRDLKPSNVLIACEDDRLVAKVADFGLAKLLDTEGSTDPELRTRSGIAMGTPCYMAPEQARGDRDIDARADLFALGALLYELLTGRRAFPGENLLEILFAISQGRYIPLRELRPDLPAHLERAVVSALEVDPTARIQDARSLLDLWTEGAGTTSISGTRADPLSDPALRERARAAAGREGPSQPRLRGSQTPMAVTAPPLPPRPPSVLELEPTIEHLTRPSGASPVVDRSLTLPPPQARELPPTRPPTRWALRIAVGAALPLTLLAGWWLGRPKPDPDPGPVDQANVVAQPEKGPDAAVAPRLTRLGFGPENQRDPTLSRDGRQVAWSDGKDLFTRRLQGERTLTLTDRFDPPATEPAFSPDGETLAFSSGGDLWLMGATGENPRQVASPGRRPAWSPDGRRIAFSTGADSDFHNRAAFDSRLALLDVASGTVTHWLPDTDIMQVDWAPDSQHLVGAGGKGVWTVSADGTGLQNVFLGGWCPRYLPDGRSIVLLGNRGDSTELSRLPLDPTTSRAAGPPTVLLSSVLGLSNTLAIDGVGKTLLLGAEDIVTDVLAARIDPADGHPLGSPSSWLGGALPSTDVDISPDGVWAAFTTTGQTEDLYVARVDGSDRRRLSKDRRYTRGPRWSGDGQRIVFYGAREGGTGIWSVRADGGDARLLSEGAGSDFVVPIWSKDGSRIAVTRFGVGPCVFATGRAWTDPSAGGCADAPGWIATSWSDDTSSLLVSTGRGALGRMSVGDGHLGGVEPIAGPGLIGIWFAPERVIVGNGGSIELLTFPGGRRSPLFSISPARLRESACLSLAPDHKTLFISSETRSSRAWIVELGG